MTTVECQHMGSLIFPLNFHSFTHIHSHTIIGRHTGKFTLTILLNNAINSGQEVCRFVLNLQRKYLTSVLHKPQGDIH